MLKFGGKTKKGKRLIGIGLSRENCKRLLEGKPITYQLEGVGEDQDVTILIVGGETEEEIEKNVRSKKSDVPTQPGISRLN